MSRHIFRSGWLIVLLLFGFCLLGCCCNAATQRIGDSASLATSQPCSQPAAGPAPIQAPEQQASGQVAANVAAQLTMSTYLPWAMVVLLSLWNFAREGGIAWDKWLGSRVERERIRHFGAERRTGNGCNHD